MIRRSFLKSLVAGFFIASAVGLERVLGEDKPEEPKPEPQIDRTAAPDELFRLGGGYSFFVGQTLRASGTSANFRIVRIDEDGAWAELIKGELPKDGRVKFS